MKDAVDENFNSRQYYLDILRIIACFMVIMIHIISMDFNNYLPATNEWKVMNSYDSIIRYSVPLNISRYEGHRYAFEIHQYT